MRPKTFHSLTAFVLLSISTVPAVGANGPAKDWMNIEDCESPAPRKVRVVVSREKSPGKRLWASVSSSRGVLFEGLVEPKPQDPSQSFLAPLFLFYSSSGFEMFRARRGVDGQAPEGRVKLSTASVKLSLPLRCQRSRTGL